MPKMLLHWEVLIFSAFRGLGIVEYIRYEIEATRRQAFKEDCRQACEILLKYLYCLAFDLANCIEDPTFYIVRIHWDSEHGHLKGSRNSPGLSEFLAPVKLYLANVREMRHY
jgi:hemoglobin